MALPLLQSKLFVPPVRSALVPRPRLLDRLNEGLHRRLTLVSAPAGFGKSTLLGAWVTEGERAVAWLSLDQGDSDPARFLRYLVAALRSIVPALGEGLPEALQTSQPPPVTAILTTLLDELGSVQDKVVLVLDDYHRVDSRAVDDALAFLLEHLPPHVHLVISTRQDPPLPLARLRARGQLNELRAAALRFTPAEVAAFLNDGMRLNLTAEEVSALERRTEGWIAGLQLAALSMRGHEDAASFIHAFTGSHHFVLDYLVEEVLQQQPDRIQSFLLHTSILDRLCGPLCDAVVRDPATPGQQTLEALDRANLFLIPLDSERRWYRYHHLFAELLRQRLLQSAPSTSGDQQADISTLHRRASQWYEDNALEVEALHHAAAAHDLPRAERLIEGAGVPLHFRGAGEPVIQWLASLPTAVLDARPSLWVTYASAAMMTGRHTTVEQKLQAAETALADGESDERSRDLIGRIASMRATVAVIQHDVGALLVQSRRALEYLHPDNLPLRTAATYTLGHAYQLQGERAAARRAYHEVIAISEAFGPSIYTTAATLSLGQVQEADNQLVLAAVSYRRVVVLAGEPPRPMAGNAYLGLAQIYYQWNELDSAQQYAQQALQLTRQMESVETDAACGILLARLKLAHGEVLGATALLAEAEAFVRKHGFLFRMADIAAAQVLALLRQGNLVAAARLAQAYDLPLSQARVRLAQGEPAAALAVLTPWHAEVAARGWSDERLKALVLEALALRAQGESGAALQRLEEALALAEPGGFIRLFVDEGLPMEQLLSEAAATGVMGDYLRRLLAAFEAETPKGRGDPADAAPHPLVDPLSPREREVLQLIAQGLSNREISERLFLALSTVKGHNRIIFDKLQVQRRTEAVARARELDLL